MNASGGRGLGRWGVTTHPPYGKTTSRSRIIFEKCWKKIENSWRNLGSPDTCYDYDIILLTKAFIYDGGNRYINDK